MLETGFDYLSEREMEIFESGDLIGSHSTAWSDVQVYASWWCESPTLLPSDSHHQYRQDACVQGVRLSAYVSIFSFCHRFLFAIHLIQ